RNIVKSEKKLLKIIHKLTNIRHSYLHFVTSEIINRKPKFIVLEDLNVKGMLKNQYLAKAIQEQCFYEFYRQMEYKCNWNHIAFITADRFYPSSKLCSCCGYVKKDLKLSERVYICPVCYNTIDRDFQASMNLMRYGLTA
ncbi:MAG: transposase, partial [Oscillospiraceae bacterium]|nr:transposase [Oscillospiraceae bacterium]